MGTVVADEISSSMSKAKSVSSSASRDSGKFWDMIDIGDIGDPLWNKYWEVLVNMLTDGDWGNRPSWYETERFNLDQYTKFEGQSKLGMTFEEFIEVFEEWESLFQGIWYI